MVETEVKVSKFVHTGQRETSIAYPALIQWSVLEHLLSESNCARHKREPSLEQPYTQAMEYGRVDKIITHFLVANEREDPKSTITT
jgi:hypothetical protein